MLTTIIDAGLLRQRDTFLLALPDLRARLS
jgi:hypothetical protein